MRLLLFCLISNHFIEWLFNKQVFGKPEVFKVNIIVNPFAT